MNVENFFDARTWTLSYVAWDPTTRDAVIIDPVLDYIPNRNAIKEDSVQALLAFVQRHDLKVHFIIDTHAHADHMSGAQPLLQALPGARLVIGEKIREVQAVFAGAFELDIAVDGSQFDVLAADGDVLHAGGLVLRAIHTPGHTPACVTWDINGVLFSGDTLFIPDFGTGRCDFPKGDAGELYDSIQRLYQYPDDTEVYVGHDYQPGGRELRCKTTIGECKATSLHLTSSTSREDFVRFRTARDRTLDLPNLLFQSIQVNVDAGRLPAASAKGRSFLKVPLNLFD
jgi:glyoxylase-like metal-dependent hydrolase (beta-lactamase superfamily II)